MSSSHSDAVHTGDIILLKVRKSDTQKAFLKSDGIVRDELAIISAEDVNEISDIRDCLFQVVFKLNYNARKDFQRLKKMGASEEEMMPVREKKELEDQQNKDKIKICNAVKYGEHIQLLHLKSNKFITVQPKVGAPQMKQCRFVEVVDGGSAHSAFCISPFYKHKTQGEAVKYNEQLLFQAGKLGTKWFLHWGKDAYTRYQGSCGGFVEEHEVNCSTISTQGFFLQLYARSQECMNFATAVRLFCTQSESFIGSSCASVPDSGRPKPAYMHHNNCDNYEDAENLWSKGVWVVESPNRIMGGPLTWDCLVCLRHAGTGRYLAVDKEQVKDVSGSDVLYYSTMKDVPDTDCHFHLEKIENVTTTEIPNVDSGARPKVLIQYHSPDELSKKLWLTSGERKKKAKPADETKAFPSTMVLFSNQRKVRDAVQLESLEKNHGDYVTDVNTVIGWKSFMTGFALKILKAPKSGLSADIQEGKDHAKKIVEFEKSRREQRSMFLELKDVLANAIFFCAPLGANFRGKPNPMQAPKTCRSDRQRICRELKFIDAAINLQAALEQAGYRVLKKSSRAEVDLGLVSRTSLVPNGSPGGGSDSDASPGLASRGSTGSLGSVGLGSTTRRSMLGGRMNRRSAAQSAVVDSERENLKLTAEEMDCLKLILVLWQRMFQDNRFNENYFEKNHWMARINDLNGLGLGAAGVFMNLVQNNARLVCKIDTQIVLDFVSFIRDLGPDDTWPNFLRQVCSCDSLAISSKQQDVLRLIYDQGANANMDEMMAYGKNKAQLLVSVSLGDVICPFPSSAPRLKPDEMLGARLVASGVQDILVHWYSKEDTWQMGKPWLYFSPSILKLPAQMVQGKEYVPLKYIAWVLNPARCYHKVHDCDQATGWVEFKAQMDASTDKYTKGRFKALEVLANYFNAQMMMLAEMCYQRQINCIYSIEKEYYFELLSCGIWNSALPHQVQCSCAFLLDNLWLDRHPHRENTMPSLVRKWTDIDPSSPAALPRFELLDKSAKSSQEFYSISAPSKFALLVGSIEHHTGEMKGKMVHTHAGHNKYISTLTEILLHLFHFGFVFDMKQLHELLKPMLACMDGRTDWLDAPRTPQVEAPQGNSVSADQRTPLLMMASPRSPRTCHTLPAHDADEPAGRSMSAGNMGFSPLATAGGWMKLSMREPPPPLAPEGALRPKASTLPPEAFGTDRYKPTEQNQIMTQCKTYMCLVCLEVNELCINHGITRILQVFKRMHQTGWKPGASGPAHNDFDLPEEMIDEILAASQDKQFDFAWLSGFDFSLMVVDLMMYDSSRLFQTAMKILFSWTHRVKWLMDALKQTQILTTEVEIAGYDRVKIYVMQLANNFATHECWGCEDSFGPIEMDKVSETKLLCERLRQLCSEGGEGSDREKADYRMQENLRNLGLTAAVIDAFRIPFEDVTADAKMVLKDIMKLVCEMVTRFLHHHPRNQLTMFDELGLLRRWFNYGVGVANCIAVIFMGNEELCERVPDNLIYDFGKTLAERARGFLPHQLSFLQSIVAVGKRPILQNKISVVGMLKKSGGKEFGEGKILHLLNCEAGQERKRDLVEGFASWCELEKPEMFRKWRGNDAEIIYHNKCIELLGMLCLGRDRVGGTAFVQSMLSGEDVAISFLNCHEVRVRVTREGAAARPNMNDVVFVSRILKTSLLKLMECCYYDTEMPDVVFLQSDVHAKVLEVLGDELEDLTCPNHAPGPADAAGDEAYMLKVLETLSNYFEFARLAVTAADPPALVNAVERLVALFEKLSGGSSKLGKNEDSLKRAMQRSLGFYKNDDRKKKTRVTFEIEQHDDEEDHGRIQKNLTELAHRLAKHPRIKDRRKENHSAMIQQFIDVAAATEPTETLYREEKELAIAEDRPMNCDFRRNLIRLQVLVTRMVEYVKANLKDFDTIKYVLKVLVNMLERDTNFQQEFMGAGVVDLCTCVMMARPDSKVQSRALRLAVLMLDPYNKKVQEKFVLQFYRVDDSGLWVAINMMYETCIQNVKVVRAYKECKRDCAESGVMLTKQEQNVLLSASKDYKQVQVAIRFMQCLCEGHLRRMQVYIAQQVDNALSFNFMLRSMELLSKICKNERALDKVDLEEMAVIQHTVEFLIESVQGPCPKNQQDLSVSGLVELSQKVLRASFNLQGELYPLGDQDDAYPEPVRKFKAAILLAVLSLLEARCDEEVHVNVLFRLDVFCLKIRLIWVHRYFLSRILKLGDCNLDQLEEQDSIKLPDGPPERILEEFSDAELQSHFDEAFNIVMLIHTISSVSHPEAKDFKRMTTPFVLELLDRNLFTDDVAYNKQQRAYLESLKYQAARRFFDRWIRSIEIVIRSDDRQARLYDYYFRMPVLCDFVLGAAKNAIVEKIDIQAPSEMAKDFVRRCVATFVMTEHTRNLSKLTLPCSAFMPKVLKKPMAFFLKHDAQKLMDLATYTFHIATIVNLILLNELVIVGVAAPSDSEHGHDHHKDKEKNPGHLAFADSQIYFLVGTLGVLYLVLQALNLLINMMLYMPLEKKTLIEAIEAESKKLGAPTDARRPETLFTIALAAFVVLAVTLVMRSPVFGVFGAIGVFSQASGRWTGHACPNNSLAIGIVTAMCSLQQNSITRPLAYTFFQAQALIGRFYFYPLLLMDLVFQKPMLQNVVKAVTIPSVNIFWTCVVGAIIMYEYAMIAFFMFRSDFNGVSGGHGCQTISDCTAVTIYQGFRADIGSTIGPTDPTSDSWYARMTYDLSYFVIMTTMFMNIMAGMVIDTFGSLRDATQEREEHMKNKCFVSGLDRGEVDKIAQAKDIDLEGCGSGYEFLENKRQNKWNYLNFIFYVKRKVNTEYTGPEQMVHELLLEEDNTWLPLTRCKMMEEDASEAVEESDNIEVGAAEMKKLKEDVERLTTCLQKISKKLDPPEEETKSEPIPQATTKRSGWGLKR